VVEIKISACWQKNLHTDLIKDQTQNPLKENLASYLRSPGLLVLRSGFKLKLPWNEKVVESKLHVSCKIEGHVFRFGLMLNIGIIIR
jgi:hypothetical protein